MKGTIVKNYEFSSYQPPTLTNKDSMNMCMYVCMYVCTVEPLNKGHITM